MLVELAVQAMHRLHTGHKEINMAHFAELNNDNKVLRVIVVSNDDIKDLNGQENEILGIAFCKSLFGEDTNWIQTSFNGTMRGKLAGIGDVYDINLNRFINNKPNEIASWVLNEKFEWVPPLPYPTDGKIHDWNESTLSWVERELNND
jgi:hypothetical protein